MKINTFVILLFLISFVLGLNEKCVSNLQCLDSACCRNNLCVTSDTCRDDVNKVYIAVGIVGFVFLVAIVIYFIVSIRNTRMRVRKLKQELNRNE